MWVLEPTVADLCEETHTIQKKQAEVLDLVSYQKYDQIISWNGCLGFAGCVVMVCGDFNADSAFCTVEQAESAEPRARAKSVLP